MRRLTILLLSLGATACLPPPQDAGEVDESSDGSGGGPGGDSGTGETMGDPTETTDPSETTGDPGMGAEWSLELEPDTTSFLMVRSPNGVVLVLQSDPSAPEATVMEISSSMQQLWSIDLPTAWVSDLTALDDGTYVLAGTSAPAGTVLPTAWRLSCCGNLDLAVEFPAGDEPSGFMVAQPLAEGLLLAQSDGMETEVMRTTLDLVPEWSATLPFYAYGGAPASAETVLLAGLEGTAHLLYEIGADGPGVSWSDGQSHYPVGTGEDLVLMTPGFEQVWFEPHDGGDVVAVSLPEFTDFEYVVDRRERFGLAFRITEESGSIVHLVEFDAAGTVFRDIVVPPDSSDHIAASAVAVGTDDAIYLAVYEVSPGTVTIPRLLRFAPS